MELVIYSEGAISYNELWSMSFYERDQFVKTINKYNAKKNGDNNEMLLIVSRFIFFIPFRTH